MLNHPPKCRYCSTEMRLVQDTNAFMLIECPRCKPLRDAAPLMLEALKDVDDAWAGNGDMATAVDAALLAIKAAKGDA